MKSGFVENRKMRSILLVAGLFWSTIGILLLVQTSTAGTFAKLSFKCPPDVVRAEVYYMETANPITGVLVLCPGENADGKYLTEEKLWLEFAASNQLGLICLSFASPKKLLDANGGYYRVDKGSGDILTQAVKRAYGRDYKLLLYGFSAGAHFTFNFANWNPERVTAWCAYSAAWWNEPEAARNGPYPPGVVACGDLDSVRRDESYLHYQRCRKAGWRVAWISLEDTNHQRSASLDEFVRAYFKEVMSFDYKGNGIWCEPESGHDGTLQRMENSPLLFSWLPSQPVKMQWLKLNQWQFAPSVTTNWPADYEQPTN